MTELKNPINQYLEANGLEYKELFHEPVGDPVLYSKQMGTRLSQQAKALMLRCKDNDNQVRYIVVTLPAEKRVDFDKVAEALGNIQSVKLAHKDKMKKITGCVPGELPPLARIWDLQLLMDKDLLNEPEVYFNAASLTHSIIASPKAIMEMEQAIMI